MNKASRCALLFRFNKSVFRNWLTGLLICVCIPVSISAQNNQTEQTTGTDVFWAKSGTYALWENGLLVTKELGSSSDTLSLRSIISGLDTISSFIDQNGQVVNFKTFKDKVVLLDFWFLRCKPCIQDLPGLDLIQKKIHSPDFEVITFAQDSMENINRHILDKRNLSFRIIPDIHIVNSLYPYKILINRRHQFVNSHVGGIVGATSLKSMLDRYLPLIQAELQKK